MIRRLLPLALAATALAGCTVGPNYRPPDVAAPPAFSEAQSTARTAISTETADLSTWWRVFNDPALDGLVDKALRNNLDLQTAESRVREARAQVKEARAAELPSVSASGNAITFNSNRKPPSSASTGGASGGSSGAGGAAGAAGGAAGGFSIPTHTNLYSVGFDATWELDLFGGVRRQVEAAKASTEAAEWAVRDARVSLLAELANDYLTLRATQARIAIGQAELKRQQDLYKLVQDRRRTGFVTDLDVEQQATQVATAAAQIPQLTAQASVQTHAIAILLGETPETVEQALAPSATPLPPPPPSLPMGLPSDLLRRRPDIRQAERRLAAANAQISVQEAQLYPQINLIGLASFGSMRLNNLFSTQNLSSIGLANASQKLFDAGKTRAQIAAAKEEKVQADLAYRKAVLSAFRDVEDGLARFKAEDERRTELARSVTSAQNQLKIAEAQYQTGFVTFINVLQAQNALLNAQDELAQSDAQVLSDLVSVYKALGGGWS